MYSQVAPPDSISECHMQNEGKYISDNQFREDGQELKNGPLAEKSESEKPAHVSEEKWLKFQQLKERRQEACKPLPEKTGRKRGRRRVDNGQCLMVIYSTGLG